MKIHIAETYHKVKPTSQEDIKKLNNELNKKSKDLSLARLRKCILSGCTFTPATFETPILDENMQTLIISKEEYEAHKNKTSINALINTHKIKGWETEKPILRRKIICWSSQQLFCLDFDSGVSSVDTIKKIKEAGLSACLLYNTFSSTAEKEKYRVVFQTKEAVTDFRVAHIIQEALMTLFSECDPACKDASRLFFGTNKQKDRFAPKNFLDIEQLFKALHNYYKEKDAHNYSRNIEKWCTEKGISIYNNMPAVTRNEAVINEFNKTQEYVVKNNDLTFIFNLTEFEARYAGYKVIQAVDENDKTIKKLKSSQKFEMHRNFDFEKLECKCKLAKTFADSKEHIEHVDLMRLITNLIHTEGGQTYFLENLKKSINLYDTQDKYTKMKTEMNYCISQEYSAYNCDTVSECPYFSECKHGKNMLEQVILKKKEIQKKQAKNKGLSLEEAFAEMQNFLTQVYRS